MVSFDEIVRQYEPMIHHMLRTLHIYKNREEFYQIGLIALWDAWRKFDPAIGNFESIAYRYIRGRMLNELAKVTMLEERNVCADESFWNTAVDSSSDPFELATLLSYSKGLSPKQQSWVVYTFHFDLTVKEIAEKENVSVSAVKKWRKGALEKLRMNVRLL